MAKNNLTACADCGGSISKNAHVCMHCGTIVDRVSFVGIGLGLLFLIGGAIVYSLGFWIVGVPLIVSGGLILSYRVGCLLLDRLAWLVFDSWRRAK